MRFLAAPYVLPESIFILHGLRYFRVNRNVSNSIRNRSLISLKMLPCVGCDAEQEGVTSSEDVLCKIYARLRKNKTSTW